MAYAKICSGSAAMGWSSPWCQKRLPNAVNSSGAVSPAIRATATMTPVMMPGARRAGARSAGGPSTRACRARAPPPAATWAPAAPSPRVVRITIGIMIRPSAKPPGERREAPQRQHHDAVGEDAEHDRRHAVEDVGQEARIQRQPPVARLGQVQPAEQCRAAARWHAPGPRGSSVPTIALAMPPPISPTGFGRCVKKSTFSADHALVAAESERSAATAATTRPRRAPSRRLMATLTQRGGAEAFMLARPLDRAAHATSTSSARTR